jgi:hypothetical protein
MVEVVDHDAPTAPEVMAERRLAAADAAIDAARTKVVRQQQHLAAAPKDKKPRQREHLAGAKQALAQAIADRKDLD